MLRVMLIIPTLVEGGAEKQLSLLAAGLPRDRFQVQVGVLTHSGPWETYLQQAGVEVVHFHKRWKVDPWVTKRVGQAIQSFKPQIVHTWLFAANAYGRFAALRNRVPVILGGERCVDPWKRSHELMIDRYLAKRTRGIITNSAGVQQFYAAKGIDPAKFFVIPNGITPQSVDRTAARAELLAAVNRSSVVCEPSAKLVVAVGRLWAQKRTKDLIWATELLHCVRDDVHLCLIGEGPERYRLERYAEKARIAHRVHFLGHCSAASKWVAGADQFWLGSGYEGQSNALMESLAAGVPAVVSDIPGNRELVTHEQTGLLFPVGDRAALARAARRLLDDAELAARLGAQASAWIRAERSVTKMVDAHAELYERLAKNAH